MGTDLGSFETSRVCDKCPCLTGFEAFVLNFFCRY